MLYCEMLAPEHLEHLEAGKPLQQLKTVPVAERTKREKKLVVKMILLQTLLCVAYLLSKDVFGAPSRRLCNLPYVLYQIALVNSFLLYLLILDRVLVSRPTNMVEVVINYAQLQYFVYCNLLTGLTNLLFWTYYKSVAFGLAVMIVYFMICAVILNTCRRCKFKAPF